RAASEAEGGRTLVADPLPHRNGALHLGATDELCFVELLRVEADRTDVVAAARGFVPLDEVGQARAAIAGDADADAVEREPDRFLGQEHERLASVLRRADRHEERDGDFLRVFESGREIDDCFACHDCFSSALSIRRERRYGDARVASYGVPPTDRTVRA